MGQVHDGEQLPEHTGHNADIRIVENVGRSIDALTDKQWVALPPSFLDNGWQRIGLIMYRRESRPPCSRQNKKRAGLGALWLSNSFIEYMFGHSFRVLQKTRWRSNLVSLCPKCTRVIDRVNCLQFRHKVCELIVVEVRQFAHVVN
jgi:hypothetical protein